MYPTQLYRKSNSEIIEVAGLVNEVTGLYANTAAVTVEIVDATSLAVVLASATMPYVAGSNGTYRYVTSKNLPVTVGQQLLIRITALTGATDSGFWEVPANVITRNS